MTAIASKFARFVARGVLAGIEGLMSLVSGAVDPKSGQREPRGRQAHDSSRVRTAAGVDEPVAYDENGRRVGGATGAPIRGEW
jgi:hypothetical protein